MMIWKLHQVDLNPERSLSMTPGKYPAVDRREFLRKSGVAAAAFVVPLARGRRAAGTGQTGSAINLPALPYAQNALAPAISENTLSFHHDKHHQAYVSNTLKLIAGTEFEKSTLEEIIKKTAGKADQAGLFNNAAQAFNHTFYWNSMKPGGGGQPAGRIAEKIRESFGSYAKFAETFSNAAATQFGSGWGWLVQDGGKLQVLMTANADTPIALALKPLITIDVWEHAYYLDYQNRRADYIKAFMESLLNWDFAERNLA
jgi:Fe-Mn family superoxide dismutase